jgi:hypothetical protein
MAEFVTEPRDRCPSCGWSAAVMYQEQKNGAGKVVTRAPYKVACSNPQCEHGAAR